MKYLEMSRNFICSVAMPLALMFAACSDDKSVAGGSAEETGIVALENITITAAAHRVVLEPQEGDTLQSGTFAMEGYESRSVAWLYELDSTDFVETGVSYSDTLQHDGDKFNFENVTLKSPYVLVRIFGKSIHGYGGTVQAIVDARKTKDVNLNLLTTLKTSLWRYLAKEGVASDSLDARAERATLDALGIVEKFSGFESKEILENPKYVMAEAAVSSMLIYEWTLIRWTTLDSTMNTLELYGNLDNLDSLVRLEFMKNLANDLADMKWITRGKEDVLDSSTIDDEVKTLYDFRRTFAKVLADVYVKIAGEDRCTEAREGDELKLAGVDLSIVCRSGGWRVEVSNAGKVLPENGTVTDARDGKAYRTVTYNIGGKSQTWMVENLKYEYGKSRCLDDSERECGLFGRLYTWADALALDSSIVWTKEECVENFSQDYAQEYIEEYEACVAKYKDREKSDIEEECGFPLDVSAECESSMKEGGIENYKYYMAKDLIDSVNHQGVCPDDWHVATADDWKGLYKYIEDTYNVEERDVVWYLLQSEYTEGPVGFGLQLLPTSEGGRTYRQQEWETTGKRRLFYVYTPIYATPIYRYGDEPAEEFSEAYEPWRGLPLGYQNVWHVEGDLWGVMFGYERYGTLLVQSGKDNEWATVNMPVRCVKN